MIFSREPFLIRVYIAKCYRLKFEGYICTDNCFIFVLVANGNIISNSQIAKQMKGLHLKYEIKIGRLEIFAANVTYNSVG